MTYRAIHEDGSNAPIVIPVEEAKEGSPFKAAKRLACKVENRNFTNGQLLRFLAEFYINTKEPGYYKGEPNAVKEAEVSNSQPEHVQGMQQPQGFQMPPGQIS